MGKAILFICLEKGLGKVLIKDVIFVKDRLECRWFFFYSVMQSDGKSWEIDTFQEAIFSELMISSLFRKLLFVRFPVYQYFFNSDLCKRVIHKL